MNCKISHFLIGKRPTGPGYEKKSQSGWDYMASNILANRRLTGCWKSKIIGGANCKAVTSQRYLLKGFRELYYYLLNKSHQICNRNLIRFELDLEISLIVLLENIVKHHKKVSHCHCPSILRFMYQTLEYHYIDVLLILQ